MYEKRWTSCACMHGGPNGTSSACMGHAGMHACTAKTSRSRQNELDLVCSIRNRPPCALNGGPVNESISLDLSPSELSFALSRHYRTKASKRQRLWWRCDAANRPPTRAPAGREPTDARHSRRARARSHHGHRAAAATPECLQAAGKLPCATTLSSLDAAVVTRDGGVE